ncbi:MAG: hypothetical protein QM426_07700 [Euryarchaeota archaeon]|nr:hypothetical protein [Euryarchaeota archaeon]
MEMDENELNEQFFLYLNKLKDFKVEADPIVNNFKELFEDIFKMEDIKLEDIAINEEENSDIFKTIFSEFDLRVRDGENQPLGRIKLENKEVTKNVTKEKSLELEWDNKDKTRIIVAFGLAVLAFDVITGNEYAMIFVELCNFLKIGPYEVIEMLNNI